MTTKKESGHTMTTTESQGNTLVVIDPRVQDYQMLARGVRPGVKVLILDDNSDGVEQITHALAKDPTESLQVVCHGAPGCLYLGKTPLSQENLSRYSQQLMEWGVGLIGPAVVREYPGVFVSFAEATNFDTGDAAVSVAVGDLNRDSQLDLAVANSRSDNVSVLLGSGDGSFGDATNFDAGNAPELAAVGDLNGDGQLDLAVANLGSDNVSVLLGSGDESFAEATNFDAGDGPNSVAIADLNGDGQLDLG